MSRKKHPRMTPVEYTELVTKPMHMVADRIVRHVRAKSHQLAYDALMEDPFLGAMNSNISLDMEDVLTEEGSGDQRWR